MKDFHNPDDQGWLYWLAGYQGHRYGLIEATAATLAGLWGMDELDASNVLDGLHKAGHVHRDKLCLILTDWRKAVGGGKVKRDLRGQMELTKDAARWALANIDLLTSEGRQAYLDSCGVKDEAELERIVGRPDNRGGDRRSKDRTNTPQTPGKDGSKTEQTQIKHGATIKNKTLTKDVDVDVDVDVDEEEGGDGHGPPSLPSATPNEESSNPGSKEEQTEEPAMSVDPAIALSAKLLTEAYGQAFKGRKTWRPTGKDADNIGAFAHTLAAWVRRATPGREPTESDYRQRAALAMAVAEQYRQERLPDGKFETYNLVSDKFFPDYVVAALQGKTDADLERRHPIYSRRDTLMLELWPEPDLSYRATVTTEEEDAYGEHDSNKPTIAERVREKLANPVPVTSAGQEEDPRADGE